MNNLNKSETEKRNKLQKEKPYVYEKCLKFDDKLAKGESIAIIQFQYNYICNFKCKHCSIARFQTDNEGKRKITIEDVKNISKQADEYGLARFVITGGEPLIFKDYDQLVDAIDPTKFFITSDTNGWFLDKSRAKHLKQIGIDKIQLSIDSLNAKEHDDFRNKPGSHERCLKAIDAAQEADLDIIIQTVVSKERLYSDEFVNFIEFLNNKNVGVFCTFLKPVGVLEGCHDGLIDKPELDYIKTLESKYNVFTHLTPSYGRELGGCIGVRGMISLTEYGDIMPCPYIHTSLGNIFNEPLKDIIEKGLKLKYFGQYNDTCWIASDKEFINNIIEKKINGKSLPVPYNQVFNSPEDYI